jgi:predicted dehydrogenase
MMQIAVIGWWGRIIVDLARTSGKLRVVRVADVNPAAREFAAQRNIPSPPLRRRWRCSITCSRAASSWASAPAG